MKTFLTVFVIAGLVLPLGAAERPPVEPKAAKPADTGTLKPKIGRPMLLSVEKNFDENFSRIWNDDPFALLGTTRGLYLDGYGAVFTAEVNVAVGPGPNPMRPGGVRPEEIAAHKVRKTQRMPLLRDAMLKMLVNSSTILDSLPPDEQIVLGVTLSKYAWEDPTAFPYQLVVQAPRKKLLELRNAKPDAIKAALRIQEF